MDCNHGVLHLWSKFSDPGLDVSQVIVQKFKGWHKDRQAVRQTDAGNDNIPEGQKAKTGLGGKSF